MADDTTVIVDQARKILMLEDENTELKVKVMDLESTVSTREQLLQKELNFNNSINNSEKTEMFGVDKPKQAKENMQSCIWDRTQHSPVHVPGASKAPAASTSEANHALQRASYDGSAAITASMSALRVSRVNLPSISGIPRSQRPQALYAATCRGNLDLVLQLLANGTNVNYRYEQSSPLHEAAGKGYAEIVSFLIGYGVHLNMRDKDGDTPLHLAAFYGNEICVEMLLDAGAYTNARNFDGNTPLHHAANGGTYACVHSLLNAGADPTRLNNKGDLPEDLARTDEIRSLLQSNR